MANGCPDGCGLCSDHLQETCTAILEVTLRCNLNCPICFSSSIKDADPGPSLSEVSPMLQGLMDTAGPCSLQLSGGEPTLRNDLPQIVALARKIGFEHIQVNTNGIRLALDPDYAQALRDAGVMVFFLQFDGVSDLAHQSIRGARLMDLKLKAIERCQELKVGVILVPTLVKNANDDQIGAIIQFAKRWVPTVKGVHFQPIAFIGRYPYTPRNQDRITLSDALTAIEEQTEGELKTENLIPSG